MGIGELSAMIARAKKRGKRVPRVHRITHPILGVTTWKEIQAAAKHLRVMLGYGVCTWCQSPVSAGRRTRCGKPECAEMIWQAYSWASCRSVALRARPFCPCGDHATEVDHIIPVSLGGTGDQSNLRPLCHDCHRAETARLRREKAEYAWRRILGTR